MRFRTGPILRLVVAVVLSVPVTVFLLPRTVTVTVLLPRTVTVTVLLLRPGSVVVLGSCGRCLAEAKCRQQRQTGHPERPEQVTARAGAGEHFQRLVEAGLIYALVGGCRLGPRCSRGQSPLQHRLDQD
jgi:hypothetical protein